MATIPEALAIALGHHQAGRLKLAEEIYRRILAAEPDHADALHLLGVLASQSGQHETAIEYIQRAIDLRGGDASFHNNLGEAYRAGRKNSEAGACFRRALELSPDSAEIVNNLGNVLKEEGNLDEAEACFRRALTLKPEFAEAHSNLAGVFTEQGNLLEAVAGYRRALELKPNYATAYSNLGNALKDLGKLEEAVASYRRALDLKPDFADASNNLGTALKEQGKLDDALACYCRAVEINPGCAEAWHNAGMIFKEQGKLQEALTSYRLAVKFKPDLADAAISLGVVAAEMEHLPEAVAAYRRALELRPDRVDVLVNLGIALFDQGNYDESAVFCARAVELQPDYVEGHVNLGIARKAQGKLDDALASYQRALELKPDMAKAHSNRATVLEELGDLKAAENAFRTALRFNPHSAFAHYKLADLLGRKLPDDDVAAIRMLLDESTLSDADRTLLDFGLAEVLDARGEFEQAAAHLERANALQLAQRRRRGQAYDPQVYETLVTQMIAACTPDFFARVRQFGLEDLAESDLPVFVVGLPRSGTTLIEQILAGHSLIFGAGELTLASDTWQALGGPGAGAVAALNNLDRSTARRLATRHLERLRALHPSAPRIVDKMPENCLLLGLLAALFPRAKFIHCRRDLRDVAVSCWMTRFEAIRWANDRQHIAARFLANRRLMEHWRKVLPSPLLEVDYEETVADLEGVARRLVAGCGLAWEPGCLEFHLAKRAVSTASSVQVRQPLYRSSVGRWKNYERPLAALFARLEGEDAVVACRRALEVDPNSVEANNQLGLALQDAGKPDEAAGCYQRAIELRPDFAPAHNNLGLALRQQGDLEAAAASYRRALEEQPEMVEACYNLGNVLREQGKLEDAVACLRRTVTLKPDFAAAHSNLGVALKDQGHLPEAVACFRRAVALEPDFAEVHSNLGSALKDLLRLDEAVACCRRSIALKPDYAAAHGNLGNALKDQGNLEEAIACYRRALELKPDFAEAHGNLGVALEEMGDLTAAEQSFRAALRHNPRYAFAHGKLAELLRGKLPEQDMAALRQLLERRDLTGAERSLLCFGLGQALDARGEYRDAAEQIDRANALERDEWRNRGMAYNPQEHETVVDRLIAICTAEFFERVGGYGPDSEAPVFVFGLPRSGTTLIEQILASHSQVFGAGEIKLVGDTMRALAGPAARPASLAEAWNASLEALPRLDRDTARRLASQHLDGLQALAPAAQRIVDKMPDNYMFLGLLTALFPRARFIHCRRDLRDTALSCWMTQFREMQWTNDFQHIGSRFRAYRRLMNHWRKVLPASMLEIDYEDTVADVEGTARKLIAWCGLGWEPACLEFYKARRPVGTVSAAQVRQPVYRTSLGRWKHYEKSLAALLGALEG